MDNENMTCATCGGRMRLCGTDATTCDRCNTPEDSVGLMSSAEYNAMVASDRKREMAEKERRRAAFLIDAGLFAEDLRKLCLAHNLIIGSYEPMAVHAASKTEVHEFIATLVRETMDLPL